MQFSNRTLLVLLVKEMKLLFIAPRFPYPLDKGDKLTVFNYLKYFSQRHSVTLITFIESENELDYLPEIQPYCDEVKTVRLNTLASNMKCAFNLFSRAPLQVSYYASREMRRCVMRTLQEGKFDMVYAHTLRMEPYLRLVENVPRVLAMQISMSLNYRRLRDFAKNGLLKKLLHSYEYAKVRRYEPKVAAMYDKCLLISQTDKAEIERAAGLLENVFINPHGVDYQYFTASPEVPKVPNRIAFTGNMNYAPNVDAVCYFCEKIFPLVKSQIENATFYIVGKNPAKRLRKLTQIDGVTVTGGVPDIRPYLDMAEISIDPLRIGAGLQNKVLEGMSMGLPMVITSIANEGIRATHEKNIIIADTEPDFATQIVKLLNEPYLRHQIGSSARQFIEEEFSWEKHLKSLEQQFQKMVSQPAPIQDWVDGRNSHPSIFSVTFSPPESKIQKGLHEASRSSECL